MCITDMIAYQNGAAFPPQKNMDFDNKTKKYW